jgi:hypothetical protein
MAKKSLERSTENLMIPQASELLPPCPLCGTSNAEKSALSSFCDLVHSHTELCAALRSVGRQMLQLPKQDGQSLERMRIVLKRADNIRQTLQLPDEYLEPPKRIDPLLVSSPSEQAISDAPIRKSVQKRRMSRPRSLRIVKFPSL